jgi:dTDP-4-dehydrorhamnose reductase
MKIILFGKNGQLGREFQHILPALGEVISLGRDEVDVADLDSVQKILKEIRPNLIINSSAYTDVDRAETEHELAMQVNAAAPGVMAEMARKLGAVFIHYSTDYVFDGKTSKPNTEDNPVNPLNVYGRSKLEGEENTQQAGDTYLILRTSWVYSLQGNSFVNKVLGWARKNQTLKIVSDQISNPTWAHMLADVTSQLIAKNKTDLLDIIRARRGVYHLAGSGYTSRYEWAKEILANDSNRTEQLVQTIEPALSKDFPTPALRPVFSALDCTRFKEIFDLQLPDWRDTLKLAMCR